MHRRHASYILHVAADTDAIQMQMHLRKDRPSLHIDFRLLFRYQDSLTTWSTHGAHQVEKPEKQMSVPSPWIQI